MSFLRRHPPFVAFFALTLVTALALLPFFSAARALIAGFDVGASVGLLLLIRRFLRDGSHQMRLRSAANDIDHWLVLVVGLIIVGVIVIAVWVELTTGGDEKAQYAGVVLALTTLALAWLFANTLFSLHYAHIWYSADTAGADGKAVDHGGLLFPGESSEPDYWDFSYFSFVLAMTFQVSDVQVTSKRMRRLALFHGLIAFVFNITVVALSVNLVADVLK